jgi:hypothetical protein
VVELMNSSFLRKTLVIPHLFKGNILNHYFNSYHATFLKGHGLEPLIKFVGFVSHLEQIRYKERYIIVKVNHSSQKNKKKLRLKINFLTYLDQADLRVDTLGEVLKNNLFTIKRRYFYRGHSRL